MSKNMHLKTKSTDCLCEPKSYVKTGREKFLHVKMAYNNSSQLNLNKGDYNEIVVLFCIKMLLKHSIF